MNTTISVPAIDLPETFPATLDRLMQSKGPLIARACGGAEVKTSIDKTWVSFEIPGAPLDIAPHLCDLFAAIVAYVKAHPRLQARSRTEGNDRYAFRCFMLRLGMSGDHYKETRRTLLANLEGDAAFLHGRPTKHN